MQNWKRYIEKLTAELDKFVGYESGDDDLSWECEKELHVLFENYKHAKAMLCEMERKEP